MDLDTVTEFVVPVTRDDLADFGEGDAFLAGGSWLFSEPQVGVRRLFDLTALRWRPIDGSEIAATCTLAQLGGVLGLRAALLRVPARVVQDLERRDRRRQPLLRAAGRADRRLRGRAGRRVHAVVGERRA